MLAPMQVTRLRWVIGVTIALHLGVLSGMWQSVSAGPRPAMSVRVFSPQDVSLNQGVTPGSRERALSASVGPVSSHAVDLERLEAVPRFAHRDVLAPVEFEPPSLLAPSAPAAVSDPQGREFHDDQYLPRPRLTVAPVLRSAVPLLWPESDGAGDRPYGHYRAVLALFIDEKGVVQRIRVDSGHLPPSLEAVSRDAFLGASFLPGELEGRQVKSLIRVEVRFDADSKLQSRGALR